MGARETPRPSERSVRGSGPRFTPRGTPARPATFRATLRDRRRVVLAPVTTADRTQLAGIMTRLQPETRFRRFHRWVGRFGEAELESLVGPGGGNHFAWGASAVDEPGAPLIGTACYRRSATDSGVGDVAIVVADAWQGVGLGRLLLDTLLVTASQQGLRRLIADVEPDNEAASRLLRRAGFRIVAVVGDTLLRMETVLDGGTRTLMSSHPVLRAI